MKEATITNKGMIQCEGAHHLDGAPMQKMWIKAFLKGRVNITALDGEAAVLLSSITERHWRDTELALSDIELNKVQDGRGVGLVSDWRNYRNDLRDWPESVDFPNKELRPSFDNTEGDS